MHNNLNKDIPSLSTFLTRKILRCDHRSTAYTQLTPGNTRWSSLIIISSHKSVIKEGSNSISNWEVSFNPEFSSFVYCVVWCIRFFFILVRLSRFFLSCTCKCKWVWMTDWLRFFLGVTRIDEFPLNDSICLVRPTAIGQLDTFILHKFRNN